MESNWSGICLFMALTMPIPIPLAILDNIFLKKISIIFASISFLEWQYRTCYTNTWKTWIVLTRDRRNHKQFKSVLYQVVSKQGQNISLIDLLISNLTLCPVLFYFHFQNDLWWSICCLTISNNILIIDSFPGGDLLLLCTQHDRWS